jgi:hypothetical protein
MKRPVFLCAKNKKKKKKRKNKIIHPPHNILQEQKPSNTYLKNGGKPDYPCGIYSSSGRISVLNYVLDTLLYTGLPNQVRLSILQELIAAKDCSVREIRGVCRE